MSWSGTVRCSHCYDTGHNKRGCPSLNQRMEERLAADPDDWRAKRFFEKKQGAKIRKCSFCKEQGHNRATCPHIKATKKAYDSANDHFRKAVANRLKESGYTIGSLVNVPEVYVGGKIGYLRNAMGVVTKILWDEVSVNGWDGYAPTCLGVQLIGNVSSLEWFAPALPPNNTAGPNWSNNRSCSVASAGSGSVGDVPDGKVSKGRLKELLSDQRWERYYDYDLGEYTDEASCGLKKSCEKYWAHIENLNKESE